MEDRAVATLLKFFLLVLLCLVQTGTSNSQCVDNLPQYGSRGTGDDVPRLAINNFYIIPNYTFSCYGNVTQWGACVENDGGGIVRFFIYRPSDDPLCYNLVGSNRIVAGTATDGCITLNVPVSDQISVEPGDVVGLAHSGSDGMNGIVADVIVSNVTTWYHTIDNFVTGPSGCLFKTGLGGNFPNPLAAAPVITAVVESFPTSTFLPPHSTSSHSPVPSTPSPSTIPSPSPPTQDGGSTLSTSTVAGIAVGAVGVALVIVIFIILTQILHSTIKAKLRMLKTELKDSRRNAVENKINALQSAVDTVTMEQNEAYQSTASTVTMEPNEAYQSTASTVTTEQNEAYQSTTNTVTTEQNEAYQSTTNTVTTEQNEAYQSTTNTVTMEQNEAYQSATDTIIAKQNEAYSGTVVGATQDVTYEEVDVLHEEV